jgi:uncharacterized membrane protein YkoI
MLFILVCACIAGVSSLVCAVEKSGLLSTLPAAVQEVVKREFPGANITEIDDGEFDGTAVYEIEGTSADGVEFELEIGADGTLYQKDEKIRFEDIEPAVLATLKKELGNSSPDEWKRMTEYGKVFYEFQAQSLGSEIELKIEPDGKILEKEVNGRVVEAVASSPKISTATAVPYTASIAATDGLVGWWKMDNIQDGKVIDSSGKGNDGEIVGICEPAEGFVGSGALQITNGGVAIADSPSLHPPRFTIAMWVNWADGQGALARLLQQGNDNKESMVILGGGGASDSGPSANVFYFSIFSTSTDEEGDASISTVKAPGIFEGGKWRHLVAIYDGSDLLLYVDGKVVGQKTIGDVTLFAVEGNPLVIGCRPPNMDRTFNGVIDDVRMYNKALSAEDIRKLYVWKGGSADNAALPNPADKSSNILPNSKLKWMKGSNAAVSMVYFGADEAAVKNVKWGDPEYKVSTSKESFDPGRLEFDKKYFWRVDSLANGKISKGDVWSFSTISGKAENPTPDPLLKNVDTNIKLTWKASSLAMSHDVYFGDDPDEVENATKGSKAHKGTLGLGKEFLDPGKLEEGKYYYWRVDENCAAGVAKGDVWQFRTKGGGLVIQVDLAVKTCDHSKLYPGLAKPGWTIWASNAWTDMYMHDYQIFPLKADGSGLDEGGINGTGVTLWFTTGNEGQLGIGAKGICRDNLGGGGCPSGTAEGDPICNSWAYGVDWVGPYAGDLLLVIRGLPAGVYQVNSYHNFWEPCTQSTRNCLNCDCGMPPMPSVTAGPLPKQLLSLDADGNPMPGGWSYKAMLPEGTGKGVESIQNAYNVAPQHVYKDSELVPSVIKFATDGSDVLIIYQADRSEPLYPDCARKGREGARGILNAFELIQVEAK